VLPEVVPEVIEPEVVPAVVPDVMVPEVVPAVVLDVVVPEVMVPEVVPPVVVWAKAELPEAATSAVMRAAERRKEDFFIAERTM
jgi:signal-induced proliferation-associated 1 like protein 3